MPGGPDGPQLFSNFLIRKRLPPLSYSYLNADPKSKLPVQLRLTLKRGNASKSLSPQRTEPFPPCLSQSLPFWEESISAVWLKSMPSVCDLITLACLKVSCRLLAGHKIDLHQGQAVKATRARQARHSERQRPGRTGGHG